MASPASQQADRIKVEQIVVQFFAKSLHIILESRIPFLCSQSSLASSTSTIGQKGRDCWFNLSLGDCPLCLEELGSVRRIISQSMAIDVLLLDTKAPEVSAAHRAGSMGKEVHELNLSSGSKSLLSCSAGAKTSCAQGIMVERWVVQFDWHKRASVTAGSGLKSVPEVVERGIFAESIGGSSSLGNSSTLGTAGTHGDFESGVKQVLFDSRGRKGSDSGRAGVPLSQLPKHVVELPALYKRAVIMLRSLYVRTRLLPAYKLFRLASSVLHNGNFSLSYNVSSPPLPLPEVDQMGMMVYSFTPVETPYGRICLSVAYRHTQTFTALEVMPPILSYIITDYVGSPTTEPSKKFLTDPYGPHGGGAGRQGVHIVSLPSSAPSSPSVPSLARHHSWSGAGNMMQAVQASPTLHTEGVSKPPSPSYPFDVHPSSPHFILPHPSLSTKHASSDQFLLSCGSPSHQSAPPSISKHSYPKISQPINIQEHCSPSFSSSPSLEGAGKEFICSGSAPFNIPNPGLPRSPKFQAADLYQPSRSPILPPPLLHARNPKPEILLRAFSGNSRLTGQLLPPGSQLDIKLAAPLSTSAESPLHLASSPITTSEQVFDYGKTGYQPFFLRLIRGSCKSSGCDATEEDFSLPFVPDDDETEQQQSIVEIPSSRGKTYGFPDLIGEAGVIHQRSQDAAVGYLIRMLNKASTLRSYTGDAPSKLPMLQNEAVSCETGMSGAQPTSGMLSSYARKTTNDATKELQAYKEMRKLLVAKLKDS